MRIRTSRLLLATLLLCLPLAAVNVRVRHREGLVHGFLTLRALDGELLANGELIQNARGDRVTSRLVFRFKDGSLSEETTVFTQRSSFRLVSDHLVQKGPAFKHPLDVSIDVPAGVMTAKYEEDGKPKTETKRGALPVDMGNGVILTLLKNVDAKAAAIKLHWAAATPKPDVYEIAVEPQGEEAFTTGSVERKAMHYRVKVELGAIKGALADLFGDTPPETHVWILEGEAPAFVKSEGPLGLGGPVWRIELTSPVWK